MPGAGYAGCIPGNLPHSSGVASKLVLTDV